MCWILIPRVLSLNKKKKLVEILGLDVVCCEKLEKLLTCAEKNDHTVLSRDLWEKIENQWLDKFLPILNGCWHVKRKKIELADNWDYETETDWDLIELLGFCSSLCWWFLGFPLENFLLVVPSRCSPLEKKTCPNSCALLGFVLPSARILLWLKN